jgi:hypothetical protein
MKSYRNCIVLLATVAMSLGGVGRAQPTASPHAVTLWDTGSPLGDAINITDRAKWKAVPPNLLMLEADPSKASSDPGHYGREYAFQGDAVVENRYLIAVVQSATGTVAVYSKADPSRKVVQFLPLSSMGVPPMKDTGKMPVLRAAISHCGVLQNTGDDVALDVTWRGRPALAEQGRDGPATTDKQGQEGLATSDLSAVLAFSKTAIVEIKPAESMKGISLLSPMEYGVAPSFVGDDLVLGAGQYPSADTLCVPAENLFLGLLKGENSMLVMTWPKGKQQLRLGLGNQGQEGRLIESIDFDNDGQSIYLALLEAPGIWHREALGASYLEKDVASKWKRPFPARWITQLWEGNVRTTYTFREAPGQIWRGVAGMYSYPIWFKGDNAFYHLSKKVLPKGESVIYFREGQDTPASVSTPVDVMKATLGRQTCDSILDLAGRKLRTHHRRGAVGIRRACTCGCTEAIEAVFKTGQEVEKKEYIEGAVGDMVYFVTRHMERLNEYRAFADDMIKFLRTTGGSRPELKAYLDGLVQIVQRIPDEYGVQKENIKTLEYADELARKTNALAGKKDPKNLPTCLELGKDWRGMGGAQDGLLAEYHIIVRRLSQEAGYGCASQPKAVELAQEIRSRCKQCLRNADGYEIWPNY